MPDYLIFRLYGPMAAWGDIAVGEFRPSFAHPSKSAVVGLLAAAIGIRRDESERQAALAKACFIGIRVDSIGTLLRDYHTTQVPSARRGVVHCTRRSELAGDELNTILSSRDYYCDAVYTIAVEIRGSVPYTAEHLADALRKPVFALYLGRKSCPPAMPLQPNVIAAKTLNQAFAGAAFPDSELAVLCTGSHRLLFWEEGLESGLIPDQVLNRRDLPLNRTRRQFGERRECYCSISAEGEPCS